MSQATINVGLGGALPIITRTAVDGDVLTRAATFEPSTWKPETGTIEVVFSTGADVVRSDFEGQYLERLSMEAAAVDLSQLRGASVLDNHDRFGGVSSVVGVVEAAEVDGKRGVARVRLSQRADLEGFRRDVADGIIRSVSAGYRVQEWRVSKEATGRVKTAVRWSPIELSFVPLGAKTRSQNGVGDKMENENTGLQTQVRGIASAVNVAEAFADGLVARSMTLEDARKAIITEAARAFPAIDGRAPVTMTRDYNDGLVERMADGLRCRINPAHKPEKGREFAVSTIADLARHYLVSRGQPAFGSAPEILQRAMHTASDFPNILAEVFGKELLSLRGDITPLTQLFRKATLSDFRAKHIMDVSDGAQLEKVLENGEIKFGTLTDKEIASYKLDSYAKGYTISFKSLVNDDLGALADLNGKVTRGAQQWFGNFLFAVLQANSYGGPKMPDNVNLFHASHGNLAVVSGAPSETTIAAGKLAMRIQKDINGDPMNATAKFIVIPAALETTVEKLIATLYPQGPADAIVSARNLTPIVEPRLDADGKTALWMLFADPALTPVLEYAELSGYEGPRVEVQQGFYTLGTEIRVVWHLGTGAIDTRGAWKNVGA